MLTRRRFIAISAALAPSMALAQSELHVETGIALGATVTLRLQHPDAPRLASLAMAEIRRLESVFSIYLPDSSLSRLNRDGALAAPPFELLDCLSLAGAVHRASGGRFDPTVQPLWQAEALALQRGSPLTDTERTDVRARIGWNGVTLAAEAITLRPGMALTLNGIAQGLAADRLAEAAARHDLTDILIDAGETRAMGPLDWRAALADARGRVHRHIALRERALATSSPMGTRIGPRGAAHILAADGRAPVWDTISVSAPQAALADGLSTALCLMPAQATRKALAALTDCRIELAIPAENPGDKS